MISSILQSTLLIRLPGAATSTSTSASASSSSTNVASKPKTARSASVVTNDSTNLTENARLDKVTHSELHANWKRYEKEAAHDRETRKDIDLTDLIQLRLNGFRW